MKFTEMKEKEVVTLKSINPNQAFILQSDNVLYVMLNKVDTGVTCFSFKNAKKTLLGERSWVTPVEIMHEASEIIYRKKESK